jgi:hypothetical protein
MIDAPGAAGPTTEGPCGPGREPAGWIIGLMVALASVSTWARSPGEAAILLIRSVQPAQAAPRFGANGLGPARQKQAVFIHIPVSVLPNHAWQA